MVRYGWGFLTCHWCQGTFLQPCVFVCYKVGSSSFIHYAFLLLVYTHSGAYLGILPDPPDLSQLHAAAGSEQEHAIGDEILEHLNESALNYIFVIHAIKLTGNAPEELCNFGRPLACHPIERLDLGIRVCDCTFCGLDLQ